MNANAPPNEDHNWTVCSESDDIEMGLPEAELDEAEEGEWSVCAEESDHDRCTEAMDYVNDLIARMNGGDSSASNVAPSIPSTPPSRPIEKTEPTEKRSAVSSQRPSSPPPRQKTPEPPEEPVQDGETAEEKRQMRIAHRPLVMAADMQRLREAANLSMSGMLKSLDQKYLMRKAYAYLCVSAGFIAASMILLSMSPQISSVAYVASAISTGVAGLTAWKYTGVARRLADVVRSDQRLA